MKWFPFSEVVTDVTSKFSKIKASDYKSQGKYKIIDQSREPVAGYTDDASLVNDQLLPVLIFGDHTRVLKYEDEPIVLGADGAKALWVNSDLAITRYVYYYLRSIEIKEAGYSRHFKFLKEVEIPIPLKDGTPDFDDQIRIAHLLGKVAGLIAQRKQHLQQLDDLLKSVFLEMFNSLQITEGGSTLGDCLKIQQGFAFRSEEFIESGTPIIKIGTVNKGFFDYSTLSYVASGYPEKVQRFEIKPGDLLISLTGTVGKDDYGNTCFVPTNSIHPTYLLNQRVGKLMCDPGIANPLFIDALLKLPKVKSALIKQNRGVRQANLSNSDIYSIRLSIPSIDLQNQFAVIAGKVEGIKTQYQQSLTDLEALYDALSQQAFKGELDLSRVPLPDEQGQPTQGEHDEQQEQAERSSLPARPITPTEVINHLLQAGQPQGRNELLARWLKQYLTNTSPDVSLGSAQFLESAWQTLQEAKLETDGETPALTLDDYDALKDLIFKALASGELNQNFDGDSNRVALQKRPVNWGTW